MSRRSKVVVRLAFTQYLSPYKSVPFKSGLLEETERGVTVKYVEDGQF